MIEEIKALLEKVTRGDDWTNMTDAGEETKYVAEYNRLTENMGGLIATCESVDAAQLIANAPEWLRYLIEHYEECRDDAVILHKQVEELQKALEDISTHVGDITSTQFYHDAYIEVKQLAQKSLERTKP